MIETHRLVVSGGASPHVVDPERGECDCPDHALRAAECKHLLAARLAVLDRDLLDGLRDLAGAR